MSQRHVTFFSPVAFSYPLTPTWLNPLGPPSFSSSLSALPRTSSPSSPSPLPSPSTYPCAP
jgi:hypothetical protein